MLRWFRRLLVIAMTTLLLCTGMQLTAEAGVGRVSGVHVGAQNRCAGTMRVKWHRVAGATYQVRWASAKSGLGAAQPIAVSRRSTTVGPLSGGKAFIQVRAVRHGKAGTWSKVEKERFGAARFGQPCALSGHGVSNGVQFTWNPTSGATRYRVRWAAAPFGKWPDGASYVSGWLPGSARSSTFGVSATPQAGDHMLGVAYANPVWGQLEARNSNGTVRHSAGFVPVFPAAPDPGPGDPVRIGSYNVMTAPAGTRTQAIAANISQHGLGVVALQESSATTAAAIVAALGGDWTYVSYTNTPQQILYRSGSYVYDGEKNTIAVHNYATGGTINTPWVRLRSVRGARSFYVVSAHFQDNPNSGVMDRKAQTGQEAQTIVDAMAGKGPVIVAGDLHYLREPFGDVPGYLEGPVKFVRSGYYDAMAALSKTNINYPTFNGGARQEPSQTGVSPRADYILLKGFRGSAAYVNVANWSYGGLIPSDHNLVYADVVVP
jgi:hypothetical protein